MMGRLSGVGRRVRLPVALGAGLLVAGLVGPAVTAQGVSPVAASTPLVAAVTPTEYIVTTSTGSVLSTVEVAVGGLGGTVLGDLPIIGGFAVSLPPAAVAPLRLLPGVVAVTPNEQVLYAGHPDATADTAAPLPVNTILGSTGASSLRNAGLTGKGVTVALIDSGVSPVADLAGRVVYGPDLTGTHTITDAVGHGTAMAGLIAGSGAGSPDAAHNYAGVAPGARLVAVKAANADGQTDMVSVLQGMTWVASNAAALNIRVLNLSLGGLATASPALQPLDIAAERLWQQGIVVVVSAGNAGAGSGSITAPGSDPMVLTAGAYDDNHTTSSADDSIPAWSSVGPTAQGIAKPDVVTPGRSLVTLAAPGSAAVTGYPAALVGNGYIKGSGTSEAAAVTSGLVALLLQARPMLTPDQVKAVLTGTASPIAGVPAIAQGAGRVNAAAANLASPGLPVRQTPSVLNLSTLPTLPTYTDWNGGTWTGTGWEGTHWEGTGWEGTGWEGTGWESTSWEGTHWEGTHWEGTGWEGTSWEGTHWEGTGWEGTSWEGTGWESQAWGDGSDAAPTGG